jgi:hypothetical protein
MKQPAIANLPSPLLMAVGLQALTTLVFAHLETTLLFKITHLVKVCFVEEKRRKSGKVRWL